jgi:hypothetical protein
MICVFKCVLKFHNILVTDLFQHFNLVLDVLKNLRGQWFLENFASVLASILAKYFNSRIAALPDLMQLFEVSNPNLVMTQPCRTFRHTRITLVCRRF